MISECSIFGAFASEYPGMEARVKGTVGKCKFMGNSFFMSRAPIIPHQIYYSCRLARGNGTFNYAVWEASHAVR